MSRVLRAVPVLLVIAAMGCEQQSASEPETCVSGAVQGIRLRVVDATTGADAPFRDLLAIAVDGSYRDTLHLAQVTAAPPLQYWYLAAERDGRYAVSVEAQGYQPWSKADVAITRNGCELESVWLTVPLQPM